MTGSVLWQGGPSGTGVSINGAIGSGSLQDAANAAMASYQHRRGGGPVIGTLAGTVSGASYSFDIGPTLGNLWFDSDTNNDGFADDVITLNNNWHFDHTTPVAPGKSDFYSVALHEVLHAIGFGASQTWNSLVSGSDWLGANAIAEAGTGVNLVEPGHIADNTMSFRLSDGALQEVVMGPSITIGTRKSLTTLDVAFLRDLGYSINAVAIPEPSGLLAVAVVSVTAVLRTRRKVVAVAIAA